MNKPRYLGVGAVVLCLILPLSAADRYPGAAWDHVKSTSDAGWSAAKLKAARAYAESVSSDAVMIVEDGLIVDAWRAIAKKILIHSIRKSYLSALYGIYVNEGIIPLSKTLPSLASTTTRHD